MDDTVLLSNTRCAMIKKFQMICKYCNDYGMDINLKKTSFFVINKDTNDTQEIICSGLKVPCKDHYLYLGSFFTDDGLISSCLKLHIQSKISDFNRFVIFCAANPSMPFYMKFRVFESALLSSLLYRCEAWLTDNLKVVETLYVQMVKTLLNVRPSTPTVNCLIELGLDSVRDLVNKRRREFLKKKLANPDLEEPMHILMKLCKDHNGAYNLMMKSLTQMEDSDLLKQICRNKEDCHTKFVIYRTLMNPELTKHPVYKYQKHYIPDYQRVALTRLRLTSHNLQSERGRWNRTPSNKRVCKCDL